VYRDAEILAVLLWAALHDRSILWACRRSSWPVQAWRRRLPDQSTMSRRLRRPEVLADLDALVQVLQGEDADESGLVWADGKPLPVGAFSQDPDARRGWGAGMHQLGFKLHALAASARRLIVHEVEPMNTPEALAAAELLERARALGRLEDKSLLLTDASYDTNPLHAASGRAGVQLLAPRRRPGTGLSDGRRHDPGRVLSMTLLEGDPEIAAWHRVQRMKIEHYFAGLVSGARLHALPPWVRTLPRVRVWVAAKIALNAARWKLIEHNVA
jgi:hypothetical protein